MPIFSRGSEKVFHIHIPRTAGRHTEQIFRSNGFEVTYNNFDYLVEGYELPHLWYPLYNSLPVHDAKHLVIVRNPVDRFTSCLKNWSENYNLSPDFLDVDEFDIEDFVQKSLKDYSSFFVPQWKFISDKSFVWKYEFGFGEEFLIWVKRNLNIDLDINLPVEEYLKRKYDFVKQPTISDHVSSLVKEYYKKDYEIFGY